MTAECRDGFFEVVPDAIVGVSRDGAILFVNSLAASLFGHEPDELVGKPIERLMPRSFCEALSHAVAASDDAQPSRKPTVTLLQTAGRRRDDSEFPAETH